MRSVSDEVERCLPYFVRLCVNSVVATGAKLDESAIEVARNIHRNLPAVTDPVLRDHFEATLADLVHLVSALAPRLPPEMIRDFAEKASQAQVAATLKRSLIGALRAAS
ncbi:hypothetical protein [Phreatobacter oligotrophus]|jgi:hypothetical protein|uniref:Uncharacterized protein n=1 Tax=Phreatobacter oligotrophus TaxID=1122261 RepID=A0A2T4Z0T8_9HYPH|nr:hypothetical protein [Phreatobacter oligotrophus]MBX9991373.1 hypothetical protein [Phreatobacter oligotrophus]PTM53357.1 hypothetical protein C8P69_10610 [Phreatobacter oligotrophus]